MSPVVTDLKSKNKYNIPPPDWIAKRIRGLVKNPLAPPIRLIGYSRGAAWCLKLQELLSDCPHVPTVLLCPYEQGIWKDAVGPFTR